MNNTSNGVSGYVCTNCGQWVYWTSGHACGRSQQVGYGSQLVALDQETKELLKRIADALEKIAGTR